MSINKVILMGHCGKEPDIRHTKSGTKVANFSMATNEIYYVGEEKKQKTEWHNVIIWGKLAEVCEAYLVKGSRVFVEGKLQTQSWEKDGHTFYKTEVVAFNIQVLDKLPENKTVPKEESQEVNEDDIPF